MIIVIKKVESNIFARLSKDPYDSLIEKLKWRYKNE